MTKPKAAPNGERDALDLEEALLAFCDPAAVKEMLAYEDARDRTVSGQVPCRRRIYWSLRQPLEGEFVRQLRSGELVATGFELPLTGSSRREVIDPELWEMLEPDFDFGMACFENLKFDRVQVSCSGAGKSYICEPTASPDEDGAISELRHSPDFSHVEMGEDRFTFGDCAAAVVAQLHEGRRSGLGWVSGKTLLQKAGSKSMSLPDLFKNHKAPSWKLLIEADGRGSYRFRSR